MPENIKNIENEIEDTIFQISSLEDSKTELEQRLKSAHATRFLQTDVVKTGWYWVFDGDGDWYIERWIEKEDDKYLGRLQSDSNAGTILVPGVTLVNVKYRVIAIHGVFDTLLAFIRDYNFIVDYTSAEYEVVDMEETFNLQKNRLNRIKEYTHETNLKA